jgi:RND family efflux transporter MFP subunit
MRSGIVLRRSTARLAAAFLAGLAIFAGGGAAQAASETFDCVMEASLNVKIGSPVSSIVADIDVDRGDVVKKGQVIAHITSTVEQAAVALNQARADSTAEIEAKQAVLEQKAGVMRRKLELEQQHVGSSQDAENARADFNVAKQELALAGLNHKMSQIELERSQAELELRTIRSPIDGIVTQRSIGPGEYFHQESTIVTIARVDPLNVETFLPVSYYKFVKIGDVATVQPNEPVGGERQARVSVVDQVFDPASGTFGVRLELANPTHDLPAGLRCRVTFKVGDEAGASAASGAAAPVQ